MGHEKKFHSTPESISSKLWRGSFLVVSGRLTGAGLGFSISAILARTLEESDFGRYSLLLATAVIFSTVARFGFDRLLLRYIAELESTSFRRFIIPLVKNAARFTFATTLIAAVGMAAVLSEFSGISQAHNDLLLIITATGIMATMTLLQLIAECFRGFHDLRRATLYDASRSGPLVNVTFLSILSALLIVREINLVNIVLCLLFSLLVISVIAGLDFANFLSSTMAGADSEIALSRQRTEKNLPARNLLRITRSQPFALVLASSGIAATEILNILMGYGDTWIAGLASSEADVARWSAIALLMQLVGMPLMMINMTIISSIPALYRRNELRELQHVLQSSATIATIISLIPLTMLICFPALIISAVYGSKFADAALPLVILALGRLVAVWTGSSGYTLMLTGHQRIALLHTVISAIAMFPLGYIATCSWGLPGLACVVSTVTILANLANWIAVRSTVGIWTHGTITVIRNLKYRSKE